MSFNYAVQYSVQFIIVVVSTLLEGNYLYVGLQTVSRSSVSAHHCSLLAASAATLLVHIRVLQNYHLFVTLKTHIHYPCVQDINRTKISFCSSECSIMHPMYWYFSRQTDKLTKWPWCRHIELIAKVSGQVHKKHWWWYLNHHNMKILSWLLFTNRNQQTINEVPRNVNTDKLWLP